MVLKISNDINIFLENIQALLNKLLRDIRKSGIHNLCPQVYLKQFKDYKQQLLFKQPIQKLLSSKIFEIARDQMVRQVQETNKLQKMTQPIFTDQSLKLVIKRQLTRIQMQQTKCQEIIHKVSALEQQLNTNNKIEEFKQHNLTNVTNIYFYLFEVMNVILDILQNIIVVLEAYIQNLQNTGCSKLMQSTNSHSIATISKQNICQNYQNYQKMQKIEDTQQIIEQKCLMSSFDFTQKFTNNKSKNTNMKPCVQCLLF